MLRTTITQTHNYTATTKTITTTTQHRDTTNIQHAYNIQHNIYDNIQTITNNMHRTKHNKQNTTNSTQQTHHNNQNTTNTTRRTKQTKRTNKQTNTKTQLVETIKTWNTRNIRELSMNCLPEWYIFNQHLFFWSFVTLSRRVVVFISLPHKLQVIKGQLGVPLTVYPWYLLSSLGILGDYNP